MKKVLIITYYWPPSGGSGVQRWLKFVKHLRGYGWESVVYIPENPEYPVLDHSLLKDVPEDLTILKGPIWEPFSIYRRLAGRPKNDRMGAGFITENKTGKGLKSAFLWIRGNFFIPDARKFWIRPSASYLTRYLKENPVDIVATTGPPMSVHMIGLKLRESVGLPWLADFRDPWTQVDFYRELHLMKWADRRHKRMEQKVLLTADCVTVVGRGMADDFRQIVDRPYPVITNGYDEEDFHIDDQPTDPLFSIAHFGSLSRRANPVILWQVLEDLIRERQDFAKKLKIKMVGQVDRSVMESMEKCGLVPFLERIPYLKHNRMVREMRRSQVLLLLVNPDPRAHLIITGKLFEYLAARRPVLFIGPEEGDAAFIVRETRCGEICNPTSAEHIKQALLEYFCQHTSRRLNDRTGNIQRFSRKNLTGELARVFDSIVLKTNKKDPLR